jgi:hypothetical protein
MIDSIKLYKDKNYIQVFFGTGSEEYLNVLDEAKRKEIFEYLRNHLPNANYRYEEYTAFKTVKKPLIALATTTLVFIWTLYYAIQIDAGNEYLLKGSGKSYLPAPSSCSTTRKEIGGSLIKESLTIFIPPVHISDISSSLFFPQTSSLAKVSDDCLIGFEVFNPCKINPKENNTPKVAEINSEEFRFFFGLLILSICDITKLGN